MSEQYHRIGEVSAGPPPPVFELVISDHVASINPCDYGVNSEWVNPSDYFITSGDAVEKTKILDRDLWHLAGSLRKQLFQLIASENACDVAHAQILFRGGTRSTVYPRFHEFESAVWKAAGQCRKLLNALRSAKGDAVFLETEFDADHRLLCIPKNPRTKIE